MKQTAIAPANIAFIKYWGRRDKNLRIPTNDSLSMNLSGATTTTTVEFLPEFTEDRIELLEDGGFSDAERRRVTKQLDVVRKYAGSHLFARVATKNSFPKSSGAASSASGFAALTVAAASALGCSLSEKELTILARVGSGSACRSIPDGFVKWIAGSGRSEDSYAYSLYPHTQWDLVDILVVVTAKAKDVPSSRGHDAVNTSPLFQTRLADIPRRMQQVEVAIAQKDLSKLGAVIEEDCLDMHRVMQTQKPKLMYWSVGTKAIMEAVVRWRNAGIPVYFTIDAGPNVHLICESKDQKRVVQALRKDLGEGVKEIIINTPSKGAHIIEEHLF